MKPIKRIYSGQNNKCCCGCSGVYYPATNTRMLKKFQAVLKAASPADVDNDSEYVAVTVGERVYIGYFEE